MRRCLEEHEALAYRPRDAGGPARHEFPAMLRKLLEKRAAGPPPRPAVCLAALAASGGGGGGGGMAAASWLQLGSVYATVPETMRHPAPVADGRLRFSAPVRAAAAAAVAALRRAAPSGAFWCAQLRVGESAWDSSATEFSRAWPATVTAFDRWAAAAARGVGLVVTDNAGAVRRGSAACGGRDGGGGRACRFVDELPGLVVGGGGGGNTSGLSETQRLAAAQLTCAHAVPLFVTTASSFSALIAQLQLHSPMVDRDAAFRAFQGRSQRSAVTFSRPSTSKELF